MRASLKQLEVALADFADAGGFSHTELHGLPDPVRRYLRTAIAPGTPLARSAGSTGPTGGPKVSSSATRSPRSTSSDDRPTPSDLEPPRFLLGGAQYGRLLDQLPQLGTEASRGRSIDHVVIDGHGQVEYLADLDLTVDDARSCRHPAHDDL
jgi:hypothetical protein